MVNSPVFLFMNFIANALLSAAKANQLKLLCNIMAAGTLTRHPGSMFIMMPLSCVILSDKHQPLSPIPPLSVDEQCV